MIDPITLLTAGPTVLRAVGSLFGSDSTAAQVAGKIADVADAVAGKPPAQQRAAVNDAVAQLSPAEREALGQIQVRLAEIEAEREARRLQHDETLAGQVAATAQAEQQYGTTYAKDTRPMLARRSGLTGLVVGGLWTVAYLADLALGTGRVPPPDAVTISALMGMAYAYMGMRTADRFSARGKS
ncbi:MAG: hypothetical protein H6981_04555 [Gammaproteobacteria bacterium]|nr:hypothetical protein [Gammaproteobacteria bacterium]